MSDDSLPCDLCGLPAQPGVYTHVSGARILVFCCEGCREIWRMLNEPDEEKDHER